MSPGTSPTALPESHGKREADSIDINKLRAVSESKDAEYGHEQIPAQSFHASSALQESGSKALEDQLSVTAVSVDTLPTSRDGNAKRGHVLEVASDQAREEATQSTETPLQKQGADPASMPLNAQDVSHLYSTQTQTSFPSPSVSLRPSSNDGQGHVHNPPSPIPRDSGQQTKNEGLGISTVAAEDDLGDSAVSGDEIADDSQSEIASIMEQFGEGKDGPGEEEIMSPRMEMAQTGFGSPAQAHPPRKSSLEPVTSGILESMRQSGGPSASPPPRHSSLESGSAIITLEQERPAHAIHLHRQQQPGRSHTSKSLPLPPQPSREPELAFDFHRFLEQLRHKTADPVAKYLRSFLLEFAKKQWMVHEQVKIISDFLDFISRKMAQCDVWRSVSDAEFDNAREGMEKLVMNRLYSQTFSPAISPQEPLTPARRRKADDTQRPGRRGQHQEDVERDEVLAQKMRIYGWVKEEHLDLAPIGEKGQKFMDLAQKELLKIKSYRAPRDKVICVLNCCKVIFGFLKNNAADQSADSFVPLLIYVVLHARPDHLVSNVQYIMRFRNQDKLGGEAGYYISSLMGAIQFVENLDRTTLTISDQDFERNVEASVSAIAEKHRDEQRPRSSQSLSQPAFITEKLAMPALADGESHRANNVPLETGTSIRSGAKSDSDGEDSAAMNVLRTIQRPLSSIGRIFSDETPVGSASSTPRPTPTPSRTQARGPRQELSAEARAAKRASVEARQAKDISAREEQNLVDTLRGMFPALDSEVIFDVVRANEGRVGKAVDACLTLSAGAA